MRSRRVVSLVVAVACTVGGFMAGAPWASATPPQSAPGADQEGLWGGLVGHG